MNDESNISKYSCTPLQKIFLENFLLYVTVWLVWIWTYKDADEKAHIFPGEVKT